MNDPTFCATCNTELKKLSEDVSYCPHEMCELYGVVVAIAKNEQGQFIEIRTGEEV